MQADAADDFMIRAGAGAHIRPLLAFDDDGLLVAFNSLRRFPIVGEAAACAAAGFVFHRDGVRRLRAAILRGDGEGKRPAAPIRDLSGSGSMVASAERV